MRTSSLWTRVVWLVALGSVAVALALAGCAKEKAAATKEVAKAGSSEATKPAQPETKPAPRFTQPLPPNNVRASHILISYAGVPQTDATRTKAEARQLAQDLLAKVKAGEDFAELARTYSDCPSAEAGGDLGPFPRGRMVRAFDEAAFALKPGEVSGIVETQFGYHIIKRTQ